MAPWIKKYDPETTDDIVGQDKSVSNLRYFIENYKDSKKKSCIIFGPSGSGKTSAVYAIGNETGLEIVEVNASDFRNKDQINQKVGSAINQMSLFSKGKIILVDEIDGLSGTKDRGGISEITKLMKKSSFPIVMTANNPFDQKFSSLRSKSELIEFQTLSYISISKRLEEISKKEGIKFEKDDIKTLARRAGGDMRSAINDLQLLVTKDKRLDKNSIDELSQRNKTESVPSALIRVLKTTDPLIALGAFENVDEDIDKLTLWIDENLPKEYTKGDDLARAYERLGRADVFKGRIRRWQHWRFLTYINQLITAGIAVAKDEKYKTYVKYSPTTRILKLWRAKMKYMKRKAIAEKIAEKTHSSTKYVIKSTLPYIQEMCRINKKERERLAEYFDLGKDEVEWLVKQ
ncbi:MAG: replication factor C large subunit [Candidatus Woesearchaeota archaeon]